MGCHSSKLDNADDSIHVMLSHAKGGTASRGSSYVPRQPHPLLQRADRCSATTTAVESDLDSQNEIDRLLYHAAHHNDTIDPRDLQDYGSAQDSNDNDDEQ